MGKALAAEHNAASINGAAITLFAHDGNGSRFNNERMT
jgi:hypothetical protein